MHKFLLLPIITLSILTLGACGKFGKSSDDGDREKVDEQQTLRPSQSSGNAEAKTGGTISIGNTIAAKSTADGCTADLIQDVTINPKDGTIRAMYSARISKFAECAGTDKSPVLYMSTQKEFKVDAMYGCKIIAGAYSIRCNGNEVKFSSTGHFQLTISGNGEFDPNSIKMRITYEERSKI